MLRLILEAAKIALPSDPNDKRNFILGAIGLRRDGVIVAAKNGAVISSTYEDYRIISDAHAECRVLRKLGKDGIIFVARVLKRDGSLAMARPCGICQHRVRAARVKKVYYSIDNYHYGIFNPEERSDRIYEVNGEQERIHQNNCPTSSGLNFSGFA